MLTYALPLTHNVITVEIFDIHNRELTL